LRFFRRCQMIGQRLRTSGGVLKGTSITCREEVGCPRTTSSCSRTTSCCPRVWARAKDHEHGHRQSSTFSSWVLLGAAA
jgi:hypothetical protein